MNLPSQNSYYTEEEYTDYSRPVQPQAQSSSGTQLPVSSRVLPSSLANNSSHISSIMDSDGRLKHNRVPGLNINGTPDMRFRENRLEGQNKDGTPDMRFKDNSKYSFNASSLSSTDGRLKQNRIPGYNKDGTLDKRFKANRGK